MRSMAAVVVGVAIALVAPASASAEPAVGVVEATLVVFDTATPSQPYATLPITGLPADQRIVGVDYRYFPGPAAGPPTGPPELVALVASDDGTGGVLQLYSLDAITGALTAKVGTATNPTPDPRGSYGVDLNPTVDRLRVVSSSGENLRIRPDTGVLVGDDPNLTPASHQISAVAYDRISPPFGAPTTTTLYALDPITASLATIGGIDATPSANSGVINQIGPLGITPDVPDPGLGFDISLDGTAYATATVGGLPGLYTVDLTTGAATSVGALPYKLRAFALAPAEALPPKPMEPIPPDTTAPTLGQTTTAAKLKLKKLLKGVTVTVGADEPVSAEVTLLASPKQVSLGRAFELTLASGSLPLGDGPRTVNLKPKRKLIGKPAKKFKVLVRVVATDAEGNETTSDKSLKIKP